MRDSYVFYRSFYEAMEDLPDKEQLDIYRAITQYALEGKEPEISSYTKAIFKLIKPQLDANIRKRENGKKGGEFGKLGGRPKKENPIKTPPKPHTDTTETPNANANANVNVNSLENENKNYDFYRFTSKLKSECKNVSKLPLQLTEEQFNKLMQSYSKSQIWGIMEQMDNKKDLTKKYTSVYRTASNWLKNNEQKQ